MKNGCVSSVFQDENVLLKLRVKREGEIAGLEISMGSSNIPPKKNHASHRNTVILPYVMHDGQTPKLTQPLSNTTT